MFKLFKKNKSEPNSDSVKKPLFAKKEKGDGEQTQPAKKSLFGKKTNTETADKPAKKSTFSLKKNKAQSDNHGADTTQPKTQGSQASIDELITDDNKTKKLIIALGVLLALVLVALAAKLFLFPDQPTNDTAPAVIDTPAQVDNTPTDNAEQAEPSDTSTPSDTLSDVAPNDTPAAAQVPVSEP
ncbi:MAG: hypothetical protein Q4G13_02350, partial [Moraxella sp.]|nr:hypothetical protein [Moraxella sp.]